MASPTEQFPHSNSTRSRPDFDSSNASLPQSPSAQMPRVASRAGLLKASPASEGSGPPPEGVPSVLQRRTTALSAGLSNHFPSYEDLLSAATHKARTPAPQPTAPHPDMVVAPPAQESGSFPPTVGVTSAAAMPAAGSGKIGRASCRERV